MTNMLNFKLINLKKDNSINIETINYDLNKIPSNYVVIKTKFSSIGQFDTAVFLNYLNASKIKNKDITSFGFEGVGEIYKVSLDLEEYSNIKGKKVAFICNIEDELQIKAFSEYSIVPFKNVVFIDDIVNYKNYNYDEREFTYLFENYFTAKGIFEDIIFPNNYKSLIIDFGSCSLGNIILNFCIKYNIKVILIASHQNCFNKTTFLNNNINNILDSSNPEFTKNLKTVIKDNNPELYLTCQGGNIPSRILDNMPDKAKMCCLNKNNKEDMHGFSTHPFIFQQKEIFGYCFFNYFKKVINNNLLNKIAKEIANDNIYATEISSNLNNSYNLFNFYSAMENYIKGNLNEKIVLNIN